MDEYIEREAATNVACNILWKMNSLSMNNLSTSVMAKALNSIPAADVAPVRHGEWEIVVGSNGKEYMVCTCCRVSQDLTGVFTYCPNCGAKMEGSVDNETD